MAAVVLDRSRLNGRVILPYAVTVAAIVVTTAILSPLRLRLGLLNVGLIYLLLVILVAARWGWGPGLVASLGANVSVNYFFVPPLYTFSVHDWAHVLALAIFLVVAALTSTLLSRARVGEATARRRAQETAILYDLSRLIIVASDTRSTLISLCERVRDTFAAESCAVLLPMNGRLEPIAWSGSLDSVPSSAYERHAAQDAMTRGAPVFLGGERGRRRPRIVGIKDYPVPIVYLPLRVSAQTIGVLQVTGRIRAQVFTEDDVRLLEAFADEAALAVDRDHLLEEAARVQALQETDRLKSVLLSAVSHDLRTPLASIKASVSSLLQSDVEWDARTRREFLTAIDEETDRLTRLVTNLLDLSRIEGGALRPEIDLYDLSELIETVVGRLRRTLPAHPLVLDLAPDVGDIPLDYVQISQVLTNLIENAAKFAPPNTEIQIGAHRAGDLVQLSVCDHGPGIPPGERERIFDKFYRIVREGERVPGSGLGLAISKGLVEAHGGRIWVEDAPGGGACFVVSLPAPIVSPRIHHAATSEVG